MDKDKKINAIIVDDERGCIANLEHYINRLCPEISIIATGFTLDEALGKLNGEKVALAFLDIEINNDNIFNSLMKIGKLDYKIVFVTAHQQYALKAIKIEALDYVLKPLAEDDILECYAKVKKHFYLPGKTDTPDNNADTQKKK